LFIVVADPQIEIGLQFVDRTIHLLAEGDTGEFFLGPCSPSSRFGRTTSPNRESSNPKPPHGIQRRCQPSAMRSPPCAAKYGVIRFLSCHGRAATVSKFPAISGSACKMPSPTPPKSAKVKLRVRLIFVRRARSSRDHILFQRVVSNSAQPEQGASHG
jgi:hypothetical protein